MKILCLMRALLAFGIFPVLFDPASRAAQGSQATQPTLPADTAYTVTERGANYRIWEKTSYELGPNGVVVPKKHHYTELASGMNYLDNGQWVESKEIIEPYASGAIARQGQYQVIFANNLNTAGAIDQQTPDNKRLRSNILGLEYYDTASGKSALIAQVQDSQGQLSSSNQVLYANAFEGIKADVQYTYKRGSFEQDVILREQPPTPESYGLDSATTVLEVMTEFFDPPSSVSTAHVSRGDILADDEVSWGIMRLGHGKAFDLGKSSMDRSKVQVLKHFLREKGRQVLLEEISITNIESQLSSLPQQSSRKFHLPARAVKSRIMPQLPIAQVKSQPMKLADLTSSHQGYVLDYVELNTDETNFNFQGDTTYYVSAGNNFAGTVNFEGGTVIKFNANGAINAIAGSTVNCQTTTYRPAIFTSLNDNTVGQNISGSSGSPNFEDVGCNVNIYCTNAVFHNVRFSYSINPFSEYATDGNFELWDSQFINVDLVLDGSDGLTAGLYNVLIGNGGLGGDPSLWLTDGGSLVAEQCTFDSTNTQVLNADGGIPLNFTNCIVTSPYGIGGIGIISTQNVAVLNNSTGIYQVAGAGNYYLAANSPYRGAGTNQIDAAVLADIAAKTTWPPIVYSNVTIYMPTTYSPQVPRDQSATPDLGYHYDTLDYAFGGVVSYSNLTFTAGTAIGLFELPGSDGNGYGISMYDNSVANFKGTVISPCTVARYSSVQEGGNGLWTDKGSLAGVVGQSLSGGYSMNPTNAAQAIANFTHFYIVAGGPNHLREYNALLKITLNNSEIYGSSMAGYWDYFLLTNCLLQRCSLGVVGGNAAMMSLRNCTMLGGSMYVEYSTTTWPLWIENCAFDGADLSDVGAPSPGNTNITYCDFNAFVTNDTTLPVTGGHDQIVTDFDWQTSWFGNYYLPYGSPLIDAGSVTANIVGLYHFTTLLDQFPEGDSIVDIGYHYVATDGNGNPLDSNGDGIPDYLEDLNGNGLVDSGEISWNTTSDPGLQIIITSPRNGSTIP